MFIDSRSTSKPDHTSGSQIGDFLFLAYANEYGTSQSMGQKLDCFCKGIEFTQSHRPEEAITDSYDKCESG